MYSPFRIPETVVDPEGKIDVCDCDGDDESDDKHWLKAHYIDIPGKWIRHCCHLVHQLSYTKIVTLAQGNGGVELRVLDLENGTCSSPLGLGHMDAMDYAPPLLFAHSGAILFMAMLGHNIYTIDTTVNPPRVIACQTLLAPSIIWGMWSWEGYLVLGLKEHQHLRVCDPATLVPLAELVIQLDPFGTSAHPTNSVFVVPQVNWRRDRHWWICEKVRRIVQTVLLMMRHRRDSVWGFLSKDLVIGHLLPLLFQESMLVVSTLFEYSEQMFIWEHPLVLGDECPPSKKPFPPGSCNDWT